MEKLMICYVSFENIFKRAGREKPRMVIGKLSKQKNGPFRSTIDRKGPLKKNNHLSVMQALIRQYEWPSSSISLASIFFLSMLRHA